MGTRVVVSMLAAAAVLTGSSVSVAQTWNSTGLTEEEFKTQSPGGPAPRRDLTGLWDAGRGGIGGNFAAIERGPFTAPFTPLGEELARRHKPGNGPRTVPVSEVNDPLSTMGDPSGFPRLVMFELRPVQMVHTPNQVLMLYMFEKRWRVIWTDGRELPKDPDPRWYGYSVGRWDDDYTFVVQTVGMDDRTWIDNLGNPHSNGLRVEERYRRVNQHTIELTVTMDDPTVYTRPWTPLNGLPMKWLPPDTDLMEMIPSASEAAAYLRTIVSQTKTQ